MEMLLVNKGKMKSCALFCLCSLLKFNLKGVIWLCFSFGLKLFKKKSFYFP